MEVRARPLGYALVVELEGELDAYWAEEAERELWGLLEQGRHRLVLDLARLDYISSAGLRVLHRLLLRLTDLGGSLVLAAPQPFVRNVFEATGFDQAFLLCDAVEEAVAAVTPAQPAVDVAAAHEVVRTPAGTFRFRRAGPGNAALHLTGHADDFLFSRATMAHLTTVSLSDLGFSLGVGAMGERGPGLLDRLGELLSVPGAVYWLPGDGRQVPDFLVAGQGSGDLPVHLIYGLGLGGPPDFVAHFEAREDDPVEGAAVGLGARLGDVHRALLAWAGESERAYAGLVGIAVRADIGELWSVGLKRSPRAERAPANGKRISHRENLRDWLHFPTEPAFPNHTLLAVGLLVDSADETPPPGLAEAALGSGGPVANGTLTAHVHGAVFGFVPEVGAGADLTTEVEHVVEQGNLVGVGHLLPTTRLRRAVLGLWFPSV